MSGEHEASAVPATPHRRVIVTQLKLLLIVLSAYAYVAPIYFCLLAAFVTDCAFFADPRISARA